MVAVIGALAGAFAGHKLQDGVSDWKDNRDEEKEKKKKEEEEEKRREEEKKRREADEKRRREEEKKNEHHRPQNGSHSPARQEHSQPRERGVNYAGNFSSSSRDTRLDAHGEFMLHTSCKRLDGSYQSTSISLNKIIENDRGSFRWFSASGSSSSSGPSSYTVQPGDTLRNIAAKFNTSFEEIARTNNIPNPDLIHPGTTLQIPGSGGCNNSSSSSGNFGASARDVRLADGGRRLEGELLRDGKWLGSSIVLDERLSNNNGTLQYIE
jgi:nucleoid-associated protein YgaU